MVAFRLTRTPLVFQKHLLLEYVLEDVFEPPIVGLEDGVLCAHVQRPLLANGILEAAVREACNRLEMAGGGQKATG